MKSFDEWNVIGKRLLRAGHITQRQLDKALKRKANGSASMKLGEILVSMGAVTAVEVDEELERQRELCAPADVDHAASDRAHEKLTCALDDLNKTTQVAAQTLTIPAWEPDDEPSVEESGKIVIAL